MDCGVSLPSEYRESVNAGRMLVVSPFSQRVVRVSAATAAARNEYVLDNSESAVFASLDPRGSLNVDRYDDRRIVRTNLLESYDELLEFSRKHLPAPFFLEEDKRLNLREIIVREMVANLLIHREFTSLDKSEFVIERERMYTSNPCNPMQDGRITPENVRPRAKNPIIAGFFREIGRADRLGSGVRNLYKYCKDYGGADPVFTEGNSFVISVSLKKLDSIRFPFEKPSIGG